ncbi:MAG: hypothetical protein OEV28_08130 [Nitrospirota bacterium]|nr:hypothetical protein [Nitrospirota bacterium]
MKRLLPVGKIEVVLALLAVSLLRLPVFADESFFYTKYNIHVWDHVKRGKHEYHASYANYTRPDGGHIIIPAGSQITILDKRRKEFNFRVESGKEKIEVEFEYHEPRMGMTLDQYLEKITSPKPVSLDHLSSIDKKGVAEGKALVGMSKEGVITALGYPATHRTPSLDSGTWIYWTNRFNAISVEFDEKGKVKGTKD